jgi:magnesium transporter
LNVQNYKKAGGFVCTKSAQKAKQNAQIALLCPIKSYFCAGSTGRVTTHFSVMIQLFQTSKSQLYEVEALGDSTWVNIVDPTFEEREWIEKNCPLVLEYLTDSLDIDELSRVEKEDDYLLVVIRLPHFRGVEHDTPFTTIPLMIFLTDSMTITICKEENVIIQEFIKERVKGFSTGKKNKFLLQLMLKTASKYLLHLRNINKIVERLEDELESSLRNREIMELLKYEKALIYYTTALQANGAMMERLRRLRIFAAWEEDDDLLEDVMIENQQAIQMTNISIRVLGQMMEAYSSVINNNMNNVMKTLTFVTICLAIPTLFASLYGMNIPLPGQESGNAFYVVLGSSSLIIAGVYALFKRVRWF